MRRRRFLKTVAAGAPLFVTIGSIEDLLLNKRAEIDLSRVGGTHYIDKIYNKLTYKTINEVLGGWAILRIKCEIKPEVVNATQIAGAEFHPKREMHLVIQNISETKQNQYFFLDI